MSLIHRLFTKHLVTTIGIITSVVALGMILAWHLHRPALTQFLPQFIPFQLSSAWTFIAVGLGLITYRRFHVLTLIMGFVILAMTGFTLAEYALSPQFFMHHFYFASSADMNSLLAGRILPLPALSFICIAMSFLCVWRCLPLRLAYVTTFLMGLFILAFSVIALFDYVVPVPPNVGWGALTRMSFIEAWLFLWVSLAIIVCIWQEAKRKKIDLKVYLPLATIFIGVTFFALVRIVLVSEEYHEVAVTVRLVSENYQSELNIEAKRYMQSLQRLQARWQYNKGVARPVERLDIKHFLHDFKAVEVIALFNADRSLAQFDYQADLTTKAYEQFKLAQIGQQLPTSRMVKFQPTRGQLLLSYPLMVDGKPVKYLVSVIDLRQLFALIGRDKIRQQVNMAIHYKQQEIYRSPLFFAQQLDAVTQSLYLPGAKHPLQLSFWPTDSLIQSVLSWYPSISFIVGVMVTLLLAFLLKLWQATERREVARRTSQRMLLKAHNKLKATTQLMIQTEKMSVLGTFAAGTAHELNNPLMGILNYVQYCKKRTDVDDPRYTVLQDAENEVLRCSQIIRNLLLFSRMENEGEEARELTDIAVIIERVLKLLTYRIRKEGVMVTTSIDPHIDLVPIQANKLQQVFVNLLSNAMDALSEQKDKEIRLNLSRIDGEAVISVSDNGCGIPEHIQRKIFDAFITTKPAGEGTGLGLAVSKHIIEEHQGRITCESVSGLGTKFTIYLPLTDERGIESDQEYISD